jgi:hypothetical protein
MVKRRQKKYILVLSYIVQVVFDLSLFTAQVESSSHSGKKSTVRRMEPSWPLLICVLLLYNRNQVELSSAPFALERRPLTGSLMVT